MAGFVGNASGLRLKSVARYGRGGNSGTGSGGRNTGRVGAHPTAPPLAGGFPPGPGGGGRTGGGLGPPPPPAPWGRVVPPGFAGGLTVSFACRLGNVGGLNSQRNARLRSQLLTAGTPQLPVRDTTCAPAAAAPP